jgi:AcrR family transcriptional regulator
MGITERREREKEEVRRKIQGAARELFAREGYDHVTMRAIADAIEYSPTTIYNHFEDKDDLVEALCNEDFAQLLAALTASEPPKDPVARIRALGQAYAAFARRYPNHYRFMFMTPRDEGHQPKPEDPGSRSFELLRHSVKQAIETGRFRDEPVDAMAQVIWASLHGVVALLVTYRNEQFPCVPPAPDLVERTIENTLRGFLVS